MRALGAAVWIASVSGFCGLAYELLWTRGLLAAMTDDTTYAFTLHAHRVPRRARPGGRREPEAVGRFPRPGLASAGHGPDARRRDRALFAALLAAIQLPINRLSSSEGLGFWSGRVPLHLAVSLLVFAPAAAFLGELRDRRPPLRRARSHHGAKHRPAIRAQYPERDPGADSDHGLADPRPRCAVVARRPVPRPGGLGCVPRYASGRRRGKGWPRRVGRLSGWASWWRSPAA